MKKLIVASAMSALLAAGAFADGIGLNWVLDLSGKVTSLSGITPTAVTPQVPSRTTITQTSVSGYLIVNPDDFLSAPSIEAASPKGLGSYATFVLVDSKNKRAVFEYYIPVWIWDDGKTVMVAVDYGPLMAVTFGTLSINWPVLKSLSTTGAAVSATWFDSYGDPTYWPAYGSLSLRNDRMLSAAAMAINDGDTAVEAYLRALGYSFEYHYNDI